MNPSAEGTFNIVVVDDSDISRRAITEALESEGWNVIGEAKSAEEALKIAGNSKVHLFIIDVVMPEISGLELAKLIHENAMIRSFVVMVSSLDQENVVMESITNGAADFLKKPFDRDDLLITVAKLRDQAAAEKLL